MVDRSVSPSGKNVAHLAKRLLRHEMPQSQVKNNYEFVRQWISSLGYGSGPLDMPRIRVYVNLRPKDWIWWTTMLSRSMKQMGWDMDNAMRTEHGAVRPLEQVPAVIFGASGEFIILVRKGFGSRYIQHEMLHIFETYLGKEPGFFEKQNIKLWTTGGQESN